MHAQVYLGAASYSSSTYAWNVSSDALATSLKQLLGYDVSVQRRDIREGAGVGFAWNVSHRWQLKDNVTEVSAKAGADVPSYAAVTSFLATGALASTMSCGEARGEAGRRLRLRACLPGQWPLGPRAWC